MPVKQVASLLSCTLLSLALGGNWDYNIRGSHGPHHWEGECFSGQEQSPIDLRDSKSVTFEGFKFFGYDKVTTCSIANTGHSFKFSPSGHESYISKGGLTSDFILAQGHFHWGNESKVGSEHFIDGRAFPLELHLVHYNAKYKSLGDAVLQKDGLAVIGIMFEIVEEPNRNLEPLLKTIKDVENPSAKSDCGGTIILNRLFPGDISTFYRYSGSLTTPGCYEVVTWTVFKYPSGISVEQLNKLRKTLLDSEGQYIVNNFRPIQDKNLREIYLANTDMPTEANHNDSVVAEKKIVWYLASVPGWSLLVAVLVSSLTVGGIVWITLRRLSRRRKGHEIVQQQEIPKSDSVEVSQSALKKPLIQAQHALSPRDLSPDELTTIEISGRKI